MSSSVPVTVTVVSVGVSPEDAGLVVAVVSPVSPLLVSVVSADPVLPGSVPDEGRPVEVTLLSDVWSVRVVAAVPADPNAVPSVVCVLASEVMRKGRSDIGRGGLDQITLLISLEGKSIALLHY